MSKPIPSTDNGATNRRYALGMLVWALLLCLMIVQELNHPKINWSNFVLPLLIMALIFRLMTTRDGSRRRWASGASYLLAFSGLLIFLIRLRIYA